MVGFFTLEGLDSGNWRALILITAIPGIIAWFFAYFYLDESPLYFLTQGETELAFFVIEKMNVENGSKVQF